MSMKRAICSFILAEGSTPMERRIKRKILEYIRGAIFLLGIFSYLYFFKMVIGVSGEMYNLLTSVVGCLIYYEVINALPRYLQRYCHRQLYGSMAIHCKSVDELIAAVKADSEARGIHMSVEEITAEIMGHAEKWDWTAR